MTPDPSFVIGLRGDIGALNLPGIEGTVSIEGEALVIISDEGNSFVLPIADIRRLQVSRARSFYEAKIWDKASEEPILLGADAHDAAAYGSVMRTLGQKMALRDGMARIHRGYPRVSALVTFFLTIIFPLLFIVAFTALAVVHEPIHGIFAVVGWIYIAWACRAFVRQIWPRPARNFADFEDQLPIKLGRST